MMGGSYFRTCECKNKHEEKRLFLYYAEMPQQKQLSVEEGILRKLERLNPIFLNGIQGINLVYRKEHNVKITY